MFLYLFLSCSGGRNVMWTKKIFEELFGVVLVERFNCNGSGLARSPILHTETQYYYDSCNFLDKQRRF